MYFLYLCISVFPWLSLYFLNLCTYLVLVLRDMAATSCINQLCVFHTLWVACPFPCPQLGCTNGMHLVMFRHLPWYLLQPGQRTLGLQPRGPSWSKDQATRSFCTKAVLWERFIFFHNNITILVFALRGVAAANCTNQLCVFHN